MSDLMWLAVALLFLVGVIAVMQRLMRSAHEPHNARSGRGIRSKTFPAVGIRYNLMACKAVEKYYDQRFLAQEAPALPVPGCNVRPCSCRYIHYVDRRAGDERRAHYGIRRNLNATANAERRRNERRQSPAWAQTN